MGDYFLEYDPNDYGIVIEDWEDTEPPQEPDSGVEWLYGTKEGLLYALGQVQADFDHLFVSTDAILRTMQIDDEHRVKLQELGYLGEVVF